MLSHCDRYITHLFLCLDKLHTKDGVALSPLLKSHAERLCKDFWSFHSFSNLHTVEKDTADRCPWVTEIKNANLKGTELVFLYIEYRAAFYMMLGQVTFRASV